MVCSRIGKVGSEQTKHSSRVKIALLFFDELPPLKTLTHPTVLKAINSPIMKSKRFSIGWKSNSFQREMNRRLPVTEVMELVFSAAKEKENGTSLYAKNGIDFFMKWL